MKETLEGEKVPLGSRVFRFSKEIKETSSWPKGEPKKEKKNAEKMELDAGELKNGPEINSWLSLVQKEETTGG